jgi:hypothetical protein
VGGDFGAERVDGGFEESADVVGVEGGVAEGIGDGFEFAVGVVSVVGVVVVGVDGVIDVSGVVVEDFGGLCVGGAVSDVGLCELAAFVDLLRFACVCGFVCGSCVECPQNGTQEGACQRINNNPPGSFRLLSFCPCDCVGARIGRIASAVTPKNKT